MQQHVLDDRIGALAVADDLFEIGVDHADQLVGLVALGLVERRLRQRLAQFVDAVRATGPRNC